MKQDNWAEIMGDDTGRMLALLTKGRDNYELALNNLVQHLSLDTFYEMSEHFKQKLEQAGNKMDELHCYAACAAMSNAALSRMEKDSDTGGQ